MTLDLRSMWDHARPELSEQRFRAAMADADAEDTLILQTQIARTYGIRREFARAQALLASLEDNVGRSGSRARVHHALESGRALASATHPPESQTPAVREQARRHFQHAFALAREHGHDALAIDALHMFAFLDSAPADQLRVAREALELVQASSQPEAQRWEGSVQQNLGYALHQLGQYDEALAAFECCKAARERHSDAPGARIAKWMIGWTLRAQGRLEAALAHQLSLADECAAAGMPDPYVFEELEAIALAQGDSESAARYAAQRQALSG